MAATAAAVGALLLCSPFAARAQSTLPAPAPPAASVTASGQSGSGSAPAGSTPSQRSLLQQVQDAFSHVASSAEPFVVNIQSSHDIDTPSESPAPAPAPEHSPAHPLKVPGAPPVAQTPDLFPKQEEATGSGLIVRADGYILTNDHVVQGSDYVTVTLSDGREFRGHVIPDYKSDLALVKIDPQGATLPVAQFADTNSIRPGQWAIAIGSPFDLQNTMTVGVVSAVHRHQQIGEDADNIRYYPDLIQTDAAINPGNSGGPLLNIDGQVIGVNVAIESPVEGSAGVGFAIPARTALYIVDQLIQHGKVVRGYLGLVPSDLTPAQQQEYGVTSGAWVEEVSRDSPAGKAGLRPTDIITQFNSAAIDGELSLRNAISQTPPGQPVTIAYIRNGAAASASMTVAHTPSAAVGDDSETVVHPQTKLGLTFRDLKTTDRNELMLPPLTSGVIVTSVAPNSPADDSGLSENDVIEQVDRERVATVSEALAALTKLQPGGTAILVVLRSDQGAISEVAIDLKL